MTVTIKTLLIAIKKMPNHDRGICEQPAITHLSIKAFNMVQKLMVQWPKYSGSYDYPVPAVKEDMTPKEQFHHDPNSLWDANTEYGALRWELLDWLIEQPELDVQLHKIHNVSATERPVFHIKD